MSGHVHSFERTTIALPQEATVDKPAAAAADLWPIGDNFFVRRAG